MANSADSNQLASSEATNLDLHCLQMQGISGFCRTRVNLQPPDLQSDVLATALWSPVPLCRTRKGVKWNKMTLQPVLYLLACICAGRMQDKACHLQKEERQFILMKHIISQNLSDISNLYSWLV